LIMDERIQLRTQGEIDASWLLAVNHQIIATPPKVDCAARLDRPRTRLIR
jgi:hypothetical protein